MNKWAATAFLLLVALQTQEASPVSACRNCHREIVDTFARSPMGRSVFTPASGMLPGEFRPAEVRDRITGRFYRSGLRAGRIIHFSDLESYEVAYAIGSGTNGRSYIVRRGGQFFLSPLSFYSSREQWDLSPGYETGVFRDFTRPISPACLGCHSSRLGDGLVSIDCERCHGEGERHLRNPAAPASIVNPAKLDPERRDDVCNQCHLGGDIRILKPGKQETDFRAGMLLDDVIAVFSLPASAGAGGVQAVSQVSQLRLSRCWNYTGRRLTCSTCHDPHGKTEAHGSAEYYHARCLSCHKASSCALSAARRRTTSPPDNCIACHMPRNPLSNVAHVAHTDHRIRRDPVIDLDEESSSVPRNLVYESANTTRAKPDLRSEALAYAEASRAARPLVSRALALLDEALRTAPRDAELLAARGRLLAQYEPARKREANQTLREAIANGSPSAEVRQMLGRLHLDAGDVSSAERLFRDALGRDAFDAASHVELVRLHLHTQDAAKARKALEAFASADPGHSMIESLRRELARLK